MNRVAQLDVKQLEYSVIYIKTGEEDVVKRTVAVCVEEGNRHVLFVSKDVAIKIKSEDILYIVNLLRGTVISKLSGAEVMLTGLCDQYLSSIRDNKALINSFSEDAKNVFDQITRDTEWSINDDECRPSTDLCNLIHHMATVCRVVLIEKGG